MVVVATKAAAEIAVVVVVVIAVVVVAVTVIAVVVVAATSGKANFSNHFQKGSPKGGPFLFSKPAIVTRQRKLKKSVLFLRATSDIVNHQRNAFFRFTI